MDKTEDPNFKVAIQKWSSGKAENTIVNEIGKVLKGSQPKEFLAWLMGLDVEDEDLKKFKLKNDIIKQCVVQIGKLIDEDEQSVVEEVERGEDAVHAEAVQVDDKEEAIENKTEEKESNVEVEHTEENMDTSNDDKKQLDEKSKGNSENENTKPEINPSEKKNDDKVKGANDKEQHASSESNLEKEEAKHIQDNVEKSPLKEDKKESNAVHENEEKSSSNPDLETKASTLSLNTDSSKVSPSENKKDHHSKEQKGSHHSSKENKSASSGGSKSDKESKSSSSSSSGSSKTDSSKESKSGSSGSSKTDKHHTDKEKRKIKCGMCDDSFEAKSGSMISCENCKKPAHDVCVKKWLGCDLKLIMEKIVGLHLTWLCKGCKTTCKVGVVKDKVKSISQSTQTRAQEKEHHKKEHKKVEEKSTEEQVIAIRKKLEAVLETGGTNKKTLELLRSLEKLSDINMFLAEGINLSILTSTKIGWTVNDIRKNSTDYDVVELAKVLIKKWKKIVPENYRGDEGGETPRKKKTVKPNDIKNVLGELHLNKKENKEQDSEMKNKDSRSKGKEKENKPKIKASFFENIKKDVERKEGKKEFVEDEKSVRKTCKNMLLEAVKGDGTLPEDIKKADFDKLSAAIEEAMFETFKQANKQYKNLVRSRVFNIKTNPSLRIGILNGNVSASRLVTMTSEEMANSNVKNQRDKFCKEGMDRFVKTFGDMQLQGNPDLKMTDFKIPKYLAPLTAPTGSSPTVSGLPSASKVSDITKAGYYSLK